MISFDRGLLALSFVLVTGCGYNPKQPATTASSPVDAAVEIRDLAVSPDTAKSVADPDGRLSDSPLAVGGNGGAGTSGTTPDTGGAAGSGGALAGATADSGGAPSSGGVVIPVTTIGGATANPDASPDLRHDIPVARSCPSPRAPVNGSVKVSSLVQDGVASYSCDPGYGTPTVASRTCQSDGTWNGTEPVCNPVDCGSLPGMTYATIVAVGTTFGFTATYTCKPGFALTGSTNMRTCQADGTWSLPIPACHVADCGPPPKLENGSVVAPKTTYNEVATYSCLPGFVLSGQATRVCQTDETWFGSAPICQAFTPKLTINKAGSGLGIVTSAPAPAAINCGDTCSATFAYNASVTITATADSGQSFVGWDSAVCKGKAPCTLTMTDDIVVNAVFSPPPNIVFVTSTEHTTNLGGLTGADEICATRAVAGGLAGTYKAWLSTSTVNAKDRLGTASGWARPDGKPVLSLVSDIDRNKLLYPPSLDELGKRNDIALVITGTDRRGLKIIDSYTTTCGDWTSNVSQDPKGFTVGSPYASSSAFTQDGTVDCARLGHLYCFGIDRTAFVAPDPTTPGRRAFTTDAYWTPGDGIASADDLCQKEASEAGLLGSFRALLAPTGATAASRFAGSEPWYRMDGLALAASASAFFTSDYTDVAPNLNAKGAYLDGWYWTGAPRMTTAAADTRNCMNWMSAVATDLGSQGRFDTSFFGMFFGGNPGPSFCNGSAKLVCLQTQ